MKLRIFVLLVVVAVFAMGVTYTIDSVKAPTSSGVTIKDSANETVATFGGTGGYSTILGGDLGLSDASSNVEYNYSTTFVPPNDAYASVVSQPVFTYSNNSSCNKRGLLVRPRIIDSNSSGNAYTYALEVAASLNNTDYNRSGGNHSLYGMYVGCNTSNFDKVTENISAIIGITSNASHNGTGTVNSLRGMDLSTGVQNGSISQYYGIYTGLSVTGTGTSTSIYGDYVNFSAMNTYSTGDLYIRYDRYRSAATNTFTNIYGHYIDMSDVDGVCSNRYAIYQLGVTSPNLFQGALELGDTSQRLTANLSNNTIEVGTSVDSDIAGTWDTDDGYITMVNNSVLTAETISPVDTTGIQLNGATNKVNIANDGNVTFAGTATYWDDVTVPGIGVKTGGSADPTWGAFKDGIYLYKFPDGSDKEVFFQVQLPHSYKEGTALEPHVHWAPSSTNAGAVLWKLEYSWANMDAAFGTSTTITGTQAGSGVALQHQLCPINSAAMTGSGKTISSIVACRLYRNGADSGTDTFTGDAFLLSIDFHVEKDSLGSNANTTK